MHKKFISYVLMISIFSLALCTQVLASNKKLKVSVSFYPVYFLTSQIGGNKVQIRTLVSPGVEPHDWEPKIKDIEYVCQSDVFIYNGAGMETWIDKVTAQANSNLNIIDASKGIKLINTVGSINGSDSGKHGGKDPHVWISVKNAKKLSYNILKGLIKSDSADKSYFEHNYNNLINKLDSLDKKFTSSLKNLRLKKIVTAHAAFAYLCKDYGLEQINLEDAFAEGEPSPKKMADIINICKKDKIKYIFSEELISPKTAQTIANECGAKNLILSPLETASNGMNYFSLMERNLKYLVKALK